MDRLIIQNEGKLPDAIVAMVMIKGLPEKGLALYSTPVGKVMVYVVQRRKSRVYSFYKPETSNLLVDIYDEESVMAE